MIGKNVKTRIPTGRRYSSKYGGQILPGKITKENKKSFEIRVEYPDGNGTCWILVKKDEIDRWK